MGRLVHNLTTGSILLSGGHEGVDWDGLKAMLTDLGMANPTAEQTLSEIESLRAPDPGHGATVKTK